MFLVSIYVRFQCKFTVITRRQQCLCLSTINRNSYKKSCSWLIERSFLTSKMRHVWRAFFHPLLIELQMWNPLKVVAFLSASWSSITQLQLFLLETPHVFLLDLCWSPSHSGTQRFFHHLCHIPFILIRCLFLPPSFLWVSIISGGAAFLAAEEPPAQWCWLAAAAAPLSLQSLCAGWWSGGPWRAGSFGLFCLDAAGPPLQAFNSSLLLES